MDTGNRADRYSQVAWREIQTRHPRAPQLRQALEHANGDPEAATQLYVTTRIAENLDLETEREAAETHLFKVQQFHDGLAMMGSVKVLLLGIPLFLVFVWVCISLFIK